MSFFSEERSNELKDLFFESAEELLQALNDEGLEFEKRPSDTEVLRGIRRTVHTLKGDSAACGFKALSELAHELEEVLTPEIAAVDSGQTAQVVLTAADVFDSMLSAYRGNVQPPSGDALRSLISGLKQNPGNGVPSEFNPTFAWTEYDRLIIQQAIDGKPVYNVAIEIDPQCAMRTAAAQLIRNVLKEVGSVLIMLPEEGPQLEAASSVEAVVASEHPQDWIARKCHVPAISSRVVVREYEAVAPTLPTPATPENDDLLGVALPDISPAAVLQAPIAIPPANGMEVAEEAQQSPSSTGTATATENLLRVDAERIDAVLNLVGELIIGKSMFHQAVSDFSKRFPKDPLRARFADMMAYQSQALNQLQRAVMKIRMVPVEQLFRRFPRVVRDIARLQDKNVELEMAGADTDLDKSILDVLAEPLTHLVRNAADHGIETPAERAAAGKPQQGAVKLNAYHQGNQVVIEVSDDGRGIDPQTIITKAISGGFVTAEAASRMTDSEILDLIFEPGFSTSEQVTEISGRGVGMDVVKTVLQRMKGSVSIQSRVGEGTTFLLKVPLTLAIIRALLFRVGERLYAVPLNSVLEIARAHESEIHPMDGREVLQLRNEVLPLVRANRLGGAAITCNSGKMFVVVISFGERKFGLVVDKLVGEEELVIKALDDQLVSTNLVSGASILGDGTVVLILNTAAVVERLGRMKDLLHKSATAMQSLGALA